MKPVEVVRTGDYYRGRGRRPRRQPLLLAREDRDQGHSRRQGDRPGPRPASPNGHKVLADGTHLICDASRHAVLHLDAAGKELNPASTEVRRQAAPRAERPDARPDHRRRLLHRPGRLGREEPRRHGSLRRPPGRDAHRGQGAGLPQRHRDPPGGKELLVGESKHNRILAFPVLAPGKLGEPKVLIDLPAKGDGQIDNQPDGIALDADGNLYVAHYGMRQVQVVSPEGKLLRRYPGGNLTTSNVAFAGPNMDQLYVTGGEPGALFRLDLPGVKGLTILPPLVGR